MAVGLPSCARNGRSEAAPDGVARTEPSEWLTERPGRSRASRIAPAFQNQLKLKLTLTRSSSVRFAFTS